MGSIHGITLNKTVSDGVASYTLSLAPNAGYGNTTITNIFGFFELFDNPVSSVIPSNYTTPSGWSEKTIFTGIIPLARCLDTKTIIKAMRLLQVTR
ncbi:hypothetical protein [Chthonomonas calidirosea]|uniref:hypothetical protein n=1 Tax=Chthonomonas calidirosea TaxID=454171 RepID=UPI000AD1D6BE|nr:hypothetical protein [Chthonomonas calidirosea]